MVLVPVRPYYTYQYHCTCSMTYSEMHLHRLSRLASDTHHHLFESKKSVGVVFLHACARTDHSVSKIIIFKSAAGSISFRSTVSQSCSIHACVGGPRPRAGRASALRWRCRRLAAACPVRLVGDIRHATAVFHKVFGQENKPGAPVTSSQGARDTNVIAIPGLGSFVFAEARWVDVMSLAHSVLSHATAWRSTASYMKPASPTCGARFRNQS